MAAGAAAVVVAAVLLHDYLDDHDLPLPPPPPPDFVNAVFWVTLDLASEPPQWRPAHSAPLVTSHFPLSGDLVAARRVRVVFALSEPIEGADLAPDAVTVDDDAGNAIPGRVSWDAQRWWVVWDPARDLPRGARLTARLDPTRVVDRSGRPMTSGESFSFSTVP